MEMNFGSLALEDCLNGRLTQLTARSVINPTGEALIKNFGASVVVTGDPSKKRSINLPSQSVDCGMLYPVHGKFG
jgi:hypothetical protein